MEVLWMLVLCVGACLARPQNPSAEAGINAAAVLSQAPRVDIRNVTGVPVVAIPLPIQVVAATLAHVQAGQNVGSGSVASQSATEATTQGTTATTVAETSTEATTSQATTSLSASTEAVQSSLAKTVVAIPTDVSSGTEAEGASPAPGSSSAQAVTFTTTTAQSRTGLIGLTNPPKSATVKVHLGEWQKGATYQVGDEVDFKGAVYRAAVHHTAEGIDWTPPQTPSMWIKVSPP